MYSIIEGFLTFDRIGIESNSTLHSRTELNLKEYVLFPPTIHTRFTIRPPYCTLQEQPVPTSTHSSLFWKHRHRSIILVIIMIQVTAVTHLHKERKPSSTNHTNTLFHALFPYRCSYILRFHVYFQRKKRIINIYRWFDPLSKKQVYTHPLPTVLLFPVIWTTSSHSPPWGINCNAKKKQEKQPGYCTSHSIAKHWNKH